LSRAFVKEDGEAERFREQVEQEKRLEDWLAIQEKKLKFLESDPKAREMDQKKTDGMARKNQSRYRENPETLAGTKKEPGG